RIRARARDKFGNWGLSAVVEVNISVDQPPVIGPPVRIPDAQIASAWRPSTYHFSMTDDVGISTSRIWADDASGTPALLLEHPGPIGSWVFVPARWGM